MSISADQARAVKVDWNKAAASTEAHIARYAGKDRTAAPSDRIWRKMIQDGQVKVLPPVSVDVRTIRENLHLSQSEFASRFGFTPYAVRQWEQGRRQPQGPARVLLTVIAKEPGAVGALASVG